MRIRRIKGAYFHERTPLQLFSTEVAQSCFGLMFSLVKVRMDGMEYHRAYTSGKGKTCKNTKTRSDGVATKKSTSLKKKSKESAAQYRLFWEP